MKTILFLCLVFLGMSMAQRAADCPDFCDLNSCTEIIASDCIANEIVPDSCGCCNECPKVLNEPCGGESWSVGKCGGAYICVGSASMKEVNVDNEERGVCKCRDMDKRVCGDDDVLYSTSCDLNEASRRSVMAGRPSITKAADGGRCKYAPVINTPPKARQVYAGQQVYLSCEVEGNPIPDVVWYRDGKKMPDYHNNIVVQVRGGPQKHHETSWIMIDSTIDDAGIYQCHASNTLGEINAQANLSIEPRPEIPEDNQPEAQPPNPI